MSRVAISLGSNLGDRLRHLRFGADQIEHRFQVLSASSLYLTAPVGGPEQGDFLNAVVLADTDLPPHDVLVQLQSIEDAAGRVRAERFGPRTLDLDLLAVEGVAIETADLKLPHPRSHQRRFVIDPLAEVWPEAPLEGGTAATLASTVGGQDVARVANQWRQDPIAFVGRNGVWVGGQLALIGTVGVVAVLDGRIPTGIAWVGLLPLILATVLLLLGARQLGPAFTPNPIPRPSQLVTSGVYALVRHPIYLGILLLGSGLVILSRSLWALLPLVLLAGWLRAKARFEEQRLGVIYPEYADYARRVSSAILPGW